MARAQESGSSDCACKDVTAKGRFCHANHANHAKRVQGAWQLSEIRRKMLVKTKSYVDCLFLSYSFSRLFAGVSAKTGYEQFITQPIP